MRYIDGETGLEKQQAEKVKNLLAALEAENSLLRERITLLESENQALRDRVALLEQENTALNARLSAVESGSLGVRKDASTSSVELIPLDTPAMRLTEDGRLMPAQPNTIILGDQENYLNDVITANVTVASSIGSKDNVGELSDEELSVSLPRPRRFTRREGRREEEIGFLAEELPAICRRGRGYDLKAVVAVLAYKVARLEARLQSGVSPL